MRSLYLRIWLTVVAVLALFALASTWLWQRHVAQERVRMETAAQGRAEAWADLLERSLPPASAPREEQAAALRDWSPEEMAGRVVRFAALRWSADSLLDAGLPGCGGQGGCCGRLQAACVGHRWAAHQDLVAGGGGLGVRPCRGEWGCGCFCTSVVGCP